MEYCNRCGVPLPSNTGYCTHCGARRVRPTAFSAPEPLPYEPPVQPVQPVTVTPVYVSAPPAEKPAKPGQGYGIAGMVLGIVALAVSGIVFFTFFFFGSLVGLMYAEGEVIGLSLAMGGRVVPYIVALPILGLSFSISARRQGYICGMSAVGVILSCVAFGLQGIMLLNSFIYLFVI